MGLINGMDRSGFIIVKMQLNIQIKQNKYLKETKKKPSMKTYEKKNAQAKIKMYK